MEEKKKPRTLTQNNAMYKWFTEWAEQLNAAGLYYDKIIIAPVNMPWTTESFKIRIWHPIQFAMFGTTSTADLTTDQVGKIEEVIIRYMGESHGLYVPFPSVEELMMEQRFKENS